MQQRRVADEFLPERCAFNADHRAGRAKCARRQPHSYQDRRDHVDKIDAPTKTAGATVMNFLRVMMTTFRPILSPWSQLKVQLSNILACGFMVV